MKLKKYKSQKSNDLNSKIKSYSALTSAFLLSAGAVQGQVIFTDINPDTLIQNSSFDIDLDHDGIKDFSILHSTTSYYHVDQNIFLRGGLDPSNKFMGLLTDQFWGLSVYYALNLPAGNPIGPGGPFYSFQAAGFGGVHIAKRWLQQIGLNTFTRSFGGFFPDTSGFIGVEFHTNGNTYYGWIECAVDDSVGSVTIKGFAYESTPNGYITGNSGNTSGIPEQQSEINASSFYPNPVTNGITSIGLETKLSGDLKIEIINGMGQILQCEDRKVNSGKNEIELNVNSLSSGTYFVKLSHGKEKYFRKIMVHK